MNQGNGTRARSLQGASHTGNILAMTPADTPEIERKVAAQLGQRLLKILAPTRVRSLSLHDATGELLWINRNEFSEAQQRQVQQALGAFALDRNLQHLERDLEDARALFFCSRTPEGDRAGLACAIVSSRRRPDIDPEALRERVFATMRRFSSTEPLPPGFGDAQLPDQRFPEQSSDSLRSRLYARLRVGGITRRYEIVDSGVGSIEQDVQRAGRLITLLKRRGGRDKPTPASFTLPLCAASVRSSDFLQRLEPMLHEAHLSHEMLGFSLPSAAWEHDASATERFIEQCGQMHCFVALDDFSLDRSGFALLRGAAVRCLKLDPALTPCVLTDRWAHANVAAIVKAARVLGLYCVAKGVKSPAIAHWLGSAGVEFADRAASRGARGGATTRRARALTLASRP